MPAHSAVVTTASLVAPLSPNDTGFGRPSAFIKLLKNTNTITVVVKATGDQMVMRSELVLQANSPRENPGSTAKNMPLSRFASDSSTITYRAWWFGQ